MGVNTSAVVDDIVQCLLAKTWLPREAEDYLRSRVELAVAQAVAEALAPFEWQPDDRSVPEPGGLESAVVGWRARCLKAEKKLASALEALEKMRQDLIDATGSAYARK